MFLLNGCAQWVCGIGVRLGDANLQRCGSIAQSRASLARVFYPRFLLKPWSLDVGEEDCSRYTIAAGKPTQAWAACLPR